jgi:hypothetical protein
MSSLPSVSRSLTSHCVNGRLRPPSSDPNQG